MDPSHRTGNLPLFLIYIPQRCSPNSPLYIKPQCIEGLVRWTFMEDIRQALLTKPSSDNQTPQPNVRSTQSPWLGPWSAPCGKPRMLTYSQNTYNDASSGPPSRTMWHPTFAPVRSATSKNLSRRHSAVIFYAGDLVYVSTMCLQGTSENCNLGDRFPASQSCGLPTVHPYRCFSHLRTLQGFFLASALSQSEAPTSVGRSWFSCLHS